MAFNITLADQMKIAFRYVKFKTRQNRLRTSDKVIAETTYGKVKGVKWISVYDDTYYSFEGIPFAKPPLGSLRFKAPQEPEPWSGVKRCTQVKSKPYQMNLMLKRVQGSEDCLYLNVYTKELNPQKPLPVLVWIYGGGFQMGEASRDMYSPDYFMMENVVLVSITYRLGALGFLSLKDPEAGVPGNTGLKDQVMALKWIKNNCAFFGGDPQNITIFGESAGGASTHYMMLTQRTRGLFHKGIIMSGSVIAPWANIPQLNWGYRLAKTLGYTGPDKDTEVLRYLTEEVKASDMFKVTDDLVTIEERHSRRLMFCFGPTIEPYVTEECVIPKSPLDMMRNAWSNEIPMLIGGNSSEGLLMFTEARKYPELVTELGNCEHIVPTDSNLNDVQRKEFGLKLKRLHFADQESSFDTLLQYSDMFSYKYFWHCIHRTLLSRAHNSTAPTWLYRFDFDSKNFNFMRILSCGRKVRGTCHADDLSYMFYNGVAKKLKHQSAEFQTIRRLVSILVKFAENGNPNIGFVTGVNATWNPVSKDDTVFQCLNISDELEVIDLPEAEKIKFWDSMYPRELLY